MVISWLIILLIMAGSVVAYDDNTPMFKTWMFANIYGSGEAPKNDPAGQQWLAEHYDFIGNADPGNTQWDALKSFNPNMEASVYTNIHELGSRPSRIQHFEYIILADIYADSGVDLEEAFLHFGDSKVWQELGTDGDDEQRYLNIDSLKAAGNDSAIRCSMRDWYNEIATDTADLGSGLAPAGDGNWLTNFTLPFYREQRAVAMVLTQDGQDTLWRDIDAGWNADGETPIGIGYRYCDNYVLANTVDLLSPGYWANGGARKIDSTFGGATGGTGTGDTTDVLSDMDTDEFASLITTFSQFFQPKIDLIVEVNDSLVAAGYGGCWPNLLFTDEDIVAELAAGGLASAVYETRGDGGVTGQWTAFGDPSGLQFMASRSHAARAANPTMLQMEEYRFAGAYTDPTHTIRDTVVANSPFSARMFKASLASFFWFYHPDYDYFKFGKANSYYWWPLHGVDIGTPSAAGYADTLSDTTGRSGQVLCLREFTNGLIIFRPVADASFRDTTHLTALEYDLGEQMYYIDENLDSTIVGPLIYISAQTGWILGDIDGDPAPTIENVIPTEGVRAIESQVGATIGDDTGLDSIGVYFWDADGPDSIAFFDTTFTAGATSYTATHAYTWLESGVYSIVHVVIDEEANTTKDSTEIIIAEPPKEIDLADKFLRIIK